MLPIFYTLHILGIAFGLGGATVSDLLFFRSLRDNKISANEFALLKTASKVVWVGLVLLIFSGAGMIWLGNGIPNEGRFYAKLTLVGIILLNGVFLVHQFVFPFIKNRVDRDFISDTSDWRLWLLAASGAISIISWYGAFLLGALRGIDASYMLIMSIYIFLISGGALAAHKILTRFLLKKAN